jgi:tRNA U34 5-carboxymethylaminomethyl modifying GTPase MnmE/TrmE
MLIAEELRRGSGALGGVVGQESSHELLGRSFSEFCVGK